MFVVTVVAVNMVIKKDSMTTFEKCLSLTGSFETSLLPPKCFGAVAGNFDNQGISFGALQFNIGQGTLQKIIKHLYENHYDEISTIIGEDSHIFENLSSDNKELAMETALSIQEDNKVLPKYKSMFLQLGALQCCIDKQVEMSQVFYFPKAIRLMKIFGLKSERALALFFDIVVQNGGINALCSKNIFLRKQNEVIPTMDFEQLESTMMRIVAEERSRLSIYYRDTLSRKMCIAHGCGNVHGINYNLDDFQLGFEEFKE